MFLRGVGGGLISCLAASKIYCSLRGFKKFEDFDPDILSYLFIKLWWKVVNNVEGRVLLRNPKGI